jgi:hypothetical protein
MGCVDVKDVDATAAQAAKAGGTVHRPPMDIPDVGRFAIVADRPGPSRCSRPLPAATHSPRHPARPGMAAGTRCMRALGTIDEAGRLKQLKPKEGRSDIELKSKRAIGIDANVPRRTNAAGVIGAG